MENRDLTNQLLEALGKFKRQRILYPTASGVPRGEFFMLHNIDVYARKHPEEPGIKISILSAKTGMSMPAVSQMLNSIEEKGLVERCMTKSDRRVVYVRLTDLGNRMMESSMKEFAKLMEQIVEEFGEENTTTLIDLFNRLNDVIAEIRLRPSR